MLHFPGGGLIEKHLGPNPAAWVKILPLNAGDICSAEKWWELIPYCNKLPSRSYYYAQI